MLDILKFLRDIQYLKEEQNLFANFLSPSCISVFMPWSSQEDFTKEQKNCSVNKFLLNSGSISLKITRETAYGWICHLDTNTPWC